VEKVVWSKNKARRKCA